MKRPAVTLRRSFQAATLALAVLLAALAWMLGRPLSLERDRPIEVTTSLEPATAGRPLERVEARDAPPAAAPGRYRPGDLLRYTFACRQLVTSDAASSGSSEHASPAALTFESTLRGSLTLKVYGENEEGWTMGIELADLEASITVAGAPAPSDPRELTAGMTTEVHAFCERSGKLRGLRFAAAVPVEARNLLRALLARFQVVLPEDESQAAWQAVEEDPTGRCLVSYMRGVQPEDGISKRKERYLETFHGGGVDVAAALAVEGETLIVLRDGLPAHIAGQEALRLEGAGIAGSLAVEDEHRFELEWRRSSPRLAEEGRRLARRGGAETWSSFAPESAAAGLAVTGSLSESLARLEALFQQGDGATPEAVELLQRIATLVQQDDEGPAKVLEVLRRRQDDVPLWQSLAGILGAAGSTAAQEALIDVMTEDGWPGAWRVTALAALAQAERPLAELDDLLTSLHEEGGDLAANALLVLGAAGSRVRDSDAERHGRIAEYVLETAERAGTEPQAAVIALEAVGNLGPGETPAAVLRAYHTGEDVVRASALRAVRRTEDPAAERLLLTALAADPSEDVRVEAAAALAARNPGAPALQEALLRDPSERVRRRAARELAAATGEAGPQRELLRWAAANDPSEAVRERAARSLDGAAVPPAAR